MRTAVLAAALLAMGGAAWAGTTTYVTLGFDDTLSDAPLGAQLLESHGMRGTFFINSPRIGATTYMTLSNVQALAAAGHEIAGHTLTHPDLTTLSTAAATSEICDDRGNLISLGFSPQDFAYPFGAYNAQVETIVQGCGYASARAVGGISCQGCASAEALPPRDAYGIATPESIKSTTTLAQMEGYVTAAEQAGGGWVDLVMHHVCDNCNVDSVSTATLGAFLDWLAPRAAQGTVVRTVSEVLAAAPPPPPPPPAGTYSIWLSTQGPAANQNASDTTSLELGVRFRSDVAGQVTALRFYKRLGSAGPHTGHLWTNTGTLLASVTFSSETASGWQTAALSAPVTIQASTTYVASYHASTGYSVTTNFFSTAGVDDAPLHALKSGVDGLNGLYAVSTSPAFPSRSTNASNYWADLVFTAASAGPAPNPSPSIAALTPSSATAGGTAFRLAVDGSGFVSTSTVLWNGAPRPTTFVGPARLLASIPASDIASTGTASVSVFTAAPGGGLSNALAFTIAAIPSQGSLCPLVKTVRKDGSGDFTGIQAAVDSVGASLSTTTCVIVQDTQTYAEQVVIQGIATNNFRLELLADPALGSAWPTLQPPAGSTAAISIVAQASVTVAGFNVVPVAAISNGVYVDASLITAPSAAIDISSVNFQDAGGMLATTGAAFLLKGNGLTLRNSAANMQAGAAISLPLVNHNYGRFNLVEDVAVSSGSVLSDGSQDTVFTRLRVHSAGTAFSLHDGLSGNVISHSTFTTESTSPALLLGTVSAIPGLLVSDVYAQSAGPGCVINGPAQSTFTLSSCVSLNGDVALALDGGPNLLTDLTLLSPRGQGLRIGINGYQNTVARTRVNAGSTLGAVEVAVDPVYLSQLDVRNASGPALKLGETGFGVTSVDQCALHGSTQTAAVLMTASSSATIRSSVIDGGDGIQVDFSQALNTNLKVIDRSTITALRSDGVALRVAGNIPNLILSSSTIAGGASGSALVLSSGATGGQLTLSSSFVDGGATGLTFGTSSSTAPVLTVSSVRFDALTPGATAVMFTGGIVVSTWSGLQFNDSRLAVNLNAAALDARSSVTMQNPSGPKSGPAFAVDPNGVVHWPPVASTSCVTSAGTWRSLSFSTQTGSFMAQFDATPGSAGTDGVSGLANGAPSAYQSLASIVRFSTANAIDAYNGSAYAAQNPIPYAPGTPYHFRLEVDLPSKRYNAYVSSAGSAERTIGTGFAFRAEQSTVTALSSLGLLADIGSETVCSLAISTWTPPTSPPPSGSYSIWLSTQGPTAAQSSGDTTSLELGVRFRADAAGQITALRFYKRANSAGPHTGHLWTNTGTLLASVDFSSETASGWQTAALASPVAIQANTTYVASYHAATGYSVATNFFTTAGVDDPPLHALKSGVDGLNGVYAVSATPAFPKSSTNASNYWADVVFAVASSTPPAPNPSPSLVSLSPSSTTVGSGPFMLTVDGANFVSTSTVLWKGNPRATTFVSASRLTAAILAADVASTGTASVSVFTAAPGGGLSNALPFTINAPISTGCFTSAGAWINRAFADQKGKFQATFNATPLGAAIDGVVGLSSAPASAFASEAAAVRFNAAGSIDALNYSTYTADSVVSYSSGAAYGFRLMVDVPNRVYDAYVTPPGGSEQRLAFGLSFRNTQSGATILNDAALVADSGSEMVCDLSVAQLPNPAPTIGNVQPTSVIAGSPGFTLTVSNTDRSFTGASVVRWNGSDRPTTLVSGQQLSAVISAADVAAAGTASVTVFTPAPGGGLSNSVPVLVRAPGSGGWSLGSPMQQPRSDFSAVTLPDGRVAVIGGYHFGPLATAEIFSSSAGFWSVLASMTDPRYLAASTVLADGRVLASGGIYEGDGSVALASADIMDPTAAVFAAAAPMQVARNEHTLTTLADGRVLAVGPDGTPELYSPAANSWTFTATTAAAAAARATRLMDGRVLVAGGGGSAPTAAAQLYNVSGGTWSAAGDMTSARMNYVQVLLADGRVLAAGGVGLASAEIFDPATNSWTPTGSMSTVRQDAAAARLPDGRVLVIGGGTDGTSSDTLATAELYDPQTGTWSLAGRMAVPRSRFGAATLPDGRVLAFGGHNELGDYEATSEIFTPTPKVGGNCQVSSGTWRNFAFAATTSPFQASFEADPLQAGTDGLAGVSAVAATDYSQLAAIVRFSTSGFIDARDGSTYRAGSAIPYVAGSSYTFRLELDLPNKRYNAYVTPLGRTEQVIGSGLAFRTEQSTVTSLADLGALADVGSERVCAPVISTWTPTAAPPAALYSDSFTHSDGLITNEYAYWNSGTSGIVVSSTWTVTAGSFFWNGNTGWTGVPDAVAPNATSSNGTGSATFRAVSKRGDFASVVASVTLTTEQFVQTSATPAQAYDGVHLTLRYTGETSYYDFSVNRRDNTAVIKKKSGSTLTTLASAARTVPFNTAQHVAAGARNNSDGSVTLTLSFEGNALITVTDAGAGGAPLVSPGAFGLRGDNSQFRVDDLAIVPASAGGGLGTVAQPESPTGPAAAVNLDSVRVYPNPWRADRDQGLELTVDGLTSQSRVRIYTASGQLVRVLDGSGGMVRWDMTNDGGRKVASGIYFYLITDDQGERRRGVLAIVR